jgi:hypothetical protein
MKINVENNEIVISEAYNGIGIKTEMGHFGIAQRDGGIEVMLDGKTVWTSLEIERTKRWKTVLRVILADILDDSNLTAIEKAMGLAHETKRSQP